MTKYPCDLVSILQKEWNNRSTDSIRPTPFLPSSNQLIQLLDVAYQASLLTEEGRVLRFRIAAVPRYSLSGELFEGELTKHSEGAELISYAGEDISFTIPRQLTTKEIKRLAPATDFTQTIICVELHKKKDKESWMIWGLIDTGSTWWDYLTEKRCDGLAPPNVLTITSTEPGNLTISREGHIIVSLDNGIISAPTYLPLNHGAMFTFFKTSIEQLRLDISKELDNDVAYLHTDEIRCASLQYLEFIKMILFYVQQKCHGGTILFIPNEVDAKYSRLLENIHIKYQLSHYQAWHNLINSAASERRYFYSRYKKLKNNKLEEKNEKWRVIEGLRDTVDTFNHEERDAARFIASLSGVDGAIVMTDKFRVLGFGAEVTVTSHSLQEIFIAEDINGTKGFSQSIEDYGTRHRSAFRFCSSYDAAVAFVVSQDGGVKAIKRIGSKVVVWNEVDFSGLGI